MSENEYIDVESRVRANTTPAALTAGMLIFFGFMIFEGSASGDGMFFTGDALFRYALRMGGLAMVAVAVMSAIGTPYALFTDAIVSGLVGLSLCVSAALMSAASELTFDYIIYFISGFTLVMAGLRNWRDYGKLPRIYGDDGLSSEVLEAFDGPVEADSNLSGALNERGERANSRESALIILQSSKKSLSKRSAATRPADDVINLDDLPDDSQDADKLEPPTPPQGYLADLARKDRPPTRPTS